MSCSSIIYIFRVSSSSPTPSHTPFSAQKSFSELLSSYTNRTKSNHWEEIPPQRLLDTLDQGCGPDLLSLCGYDPDRSPEETLSLIKTVLEWFRQVIAVSTRLASTPFFLSFFSVLHFFSENSMATSPLKAAGSTSQLVRTEAANEAKQRTLRNRAYQRACGR